MPRMAAALTAVLLLLTACGTTPQDRAITGAGIGAAGGAILGAITGLTVVEGALIGAGAGGITGALTDNRLINLGAPIWEQISGSSHGGAASPLVARTQRGLARLGYDPGPADGRYGPRTAAAIRAYQAANGLPVDGQASGRLAERIEGAGSA